MKKLYYGGTIISLEEPLYPQALLCDGDRILAAGELQELMAQEAELIDLRGRCLLPAFIDSHSHFSQLASSLLQVSLDGVSSPEQMKERISDFIHERGLKPGEWIQARDYNNNLFKDSKNPGLDILDGLCPGYKLIIHHKSGHMGLLNSAAMAALGLSPQTVPPEGGRIGLEGGRLNGYLEENAFFSYLKKLPMPSMDSLMDAYRRAQEIYASHGICTIQEGMLAREMLPIYRRLLSEDILKMELVVYPSPDCLEDSRALLAEAANPHCRLGGIKIFLDGSPQGRTAWMKSPYLGEPEGYCGYGTMEDEQVLSAFELAAREGLQLLAHCNGDAAAEQFLNCLELSQRAYPQLKKLRPVLIHGQLMGIDQLKRAAELGAMVSFFVAHVYHWGDTHIENFGLSRAMEISPAASAKRAGLPFSFHQDSPVISPDMLETIWCAAARYTKSGRLLGAQERISRRDALEAVTKTAAWQYFQEDSKGSLAPGKSADLVILSSDPLSCPLDELRQIRVEATIKAGVLV